MLSTPLRLAPPERRELKRRLRARSARAEDARRAELILRLAGGESYATIRGALRCGQSYISRWKSRFLAERIAGLYSRHRGRAVRKNSATLQARILDHTRRGPSDGSTHWSTRKLAQKLGLNHMAVARAWKSAGLQPHRMRRYMESDDPFFEAKAAQIIGLYLRPPAHAAVFCVDEKSAIQALDRLDPVLPLSPGRAERHGFEYYRHGTLSLFAALEIKSGEVIGKTAPRHTSAEFVAFLSDLVAHQPTARPIHIIADNLSTHKTKGVEEFLQSHPQVTLHYTPTYSSWLNQIELWFSKLQRDVIARGIFTSRLDLKRKIMRYLRHYNKTAQPFKWSLPQRF
ncbi:IS630 family transposase [soil metagenome]